MADQCFTWNIGLNDGGLLEDLPPPPDLAPEVGERLERFVGLIRSWSHTVNLVSRNDLESLRERHLDDCLQLLALLPPQGVIVDLGSGAGFPGLVVAIATGRPVHLVEVDRRKAAFLREAARACGAEVTVHATRIEQVILPPAACVTARALAPLTLLLGWIAPLLATQGYALLHKGSQAEAELTHAATEWQMQLRRWRSRTDGEATILQVSKLARRRGTG